MSKQTDIESTRQDSERKRYVWPEEVQWPLSISSERQEDREDLFEEDGEYDLLLEGSPAYKRNDV